MILTLRDIATCLGLPALAAATLVACQPAFEVPDAGPLRVAECIASTCTDLELDYASLDDYTQLGALSHVTNLMMSSTDIADLGDLAAMGQLRGLHIGNTQVRDLSGLAAFPNLTLLHMQGIAPTSWAPLANAANLREIAIGHSQLNDLSFLAQAPQIQRLHLSHIPDDLDLATLGAHPGLRAIHLGENDGFSGPNTLDLSPLLALPNLRQVSLILWDEGEHADTLARLRARGVQVNIEEPVVIVC